MRVEGRRAIEHGGASGEQYDDDQECHPDAAQLDRSLKDQLEEFEDNEAPTARCLARRVARRTTASMARYPQTVICRKMSSAYELDKAKRARG